MGFGEDILTALDRIPGWKRLQEVPSEVDDLKARIGALEAQMGGKCPPDFCRFCGERAARIAGGHVDKGIVTEIWECNKCGDRDFRYHKAGPRA
jgi:hypothetical protein